MANVRAYKIAEELGLDRNDFVERARAIGIELKSAMAAVGEDDAAVLREKLGSRHAGSTTEARVERVGGAIIRRRKRSTPDENKAEVSPVPTEAPTPKLEVPSDKAESSVSEDIETPSEQNVAEERAAETEVTATPDQEKEEAASKTEESKVDKKSPSHVADRSQQMALSDRKGRQRKQFKEVVNLREQEQIARQVTSRTTGRVPTATVLPRQFPAQMRKRRAKADVKPVQKQPRRLVRVDQVINVGELAKQLGVKVAEVQGKLMGIGTMVSVNQAIDVATAGLVAEQYGYEIQNVGFQESAYLDPGDAVSEEGVSEESRPPVVTVMGHVDHGKTSLLDALRETRVVDSEAGGITQHIGAYQVRLGDRHISFIDTPGHAAFTAMRARGASVTDVVVLVVAASDGIMPQTVEAIDHAKAAGVPIVVAVNKCDLPDANPQLVRQRLMEHDIVPEDFGGEVQCVDVSAIKRTGLDALLEAIQLQSELLELSANTSRRAEGIVLEAKIDKGRGTVATVLVREGVLKQGDAIVVDSHAGRVRSMLNEHGQVVNEAGPSTPVQLIGLSAVPNAGSQLNAVENERIAKQIVAHREERRRQGSEIQPRAQVSLDDLFSQTDIGGFIELNVVIKADAHGSVEALRDALLQIESEKVGLKVIHGAVGAVTESDAQLAKASNAIVIGFNVRADSAGRRAVEENSIDMRSYQVIYEAIDDVRNAMAGLLPPTIREKFLGRAEVRNTFIIPKIGTIAGCYIAEGLIRRAASCRLLRDGVQVYSGKFGSLKRFKDDAREVQTGFECGIGIEGFNDIKVSDVIEAFELEELPAEL